MKIALIAPSFLPARRANTIQVMKMAQAFMKLNHAVHVTVPGPAPDLSKISISAHYGLTQDFPISWFPSNPTLRRYDYAIRAIRFARQWRTDILFTRVPQAAAISSLLGMDTLFELHDFPPGKCGPVLFRLFLKGKGRSCIVTISQALMDVLEQSFPLDRVSIDKVVAPDGIDLDRYRDLPSPSESRTRLSAMNKINNLSPHTFTAGYTGHLYPGRGTNLLLKIAEALPEYNFLIVGGEPEDVRAFNSEIDSKDLRNMVTTGFIPNSELPLFQSACDALLMPYQTTIAASSGGDISRYLSPMKMFEYLACQRPILSSDLPVLREILTPENAILLPPDTPDAWINTLRDICDNPQKYHQMTVQARETAEAHTWENRANRILSYLTTTPG